MSSMETDRIRQGKVRLIAFTSTLDSKEGEPQPLNPEFRALLFTCCKHHCDIQVPQKSVCGWFTLCLFS